MRQGRLRAQKYRQAFGGGIRHRTRCYQHRLEGCARGRIMSNFFSMEREVAMRFFRLTPINLDDPNWSRSEEHTSELQSLMRISYAVFCLKKKTKKNIKKTR